MSQNGYGKETTDAKTQSHRGHPVGSHKAPMQRNGARSQVVHSVPLSIVGRVQKQSPDFRRGLPRRARRRTSKRDWKLPVEIQRKSRASVFWGMLPPRAQAEQATSGNAHSPSLCVHFSHSRIPMWPFQTYSTSLCGHCGHIPPGAIAGIFLIPVRPYRAYSTFPWAITGILVSHPLPPSSPPPTAMWDGL